MLSLSKLASFQTSAKNMVQEVYPRTVDANWLIDNVTTTLVVYQRLMLVSGPEQMRTNLDRLLELRQGINNALDQLEATITDEKSVNQLRTIRTQRGEYVKSGDRIVSLINTGDREAAIQEFNDNMNNIQRQYRDSIRQLFTLQDDLMTTSVDRMAQVYAEIRMILLLMLAFGAVLGALIAWSMTRSVRRPLQQALAIAERVAQGDLSSTIVVRNRDETGQLLKALAQMNASLHRIVCQVREGAENISSAASQIAAGNRDLSARTEEQASSLEQTASSMEQLTATIKNTAENTQQATTIAQQALQAAQRSGEVMESVTLKMRGIRDGSQHMAEIIGAIDGIAFQTNILALNVAVEAARAGEKGSGFAVVAGEVRALAQRSATAAKEIKALIDDSVSNIQDGIQLVDVAEDTMSGLAAHVREVGTIINEIAQASREQSEGINQINLAVGQIDTTTQQNAALVEESASASLSLQSQAALLSEAVSVFRLQTEQDTRQDPVRAGEPQRLALPGRQKARNTTPVSGDENWTTF